MCSTVQEQITTCGQNAIVKIGERTNIRPQLVKPLSREASNEHLLLIFALFLTFTNYL